MIPLNTLRPSANLAAPTCFVQPFRNLYGPFSPTQIPSKLPVDVKDSRRRLEEPLAVGSSVEKERDGSWSASHRQEGAWGERLMSGYDGTSRPRAHPKDDNGSSRLEPYGPPFSDTKSQSGPARSPAEDRPEGQQQPRFSLPPLPPLRPVTPAQEAERMATRSLGVQSILNPPPQGERPQIAGRRRSASQMEGSSSPERRVTTYFSGLGRPGGEASDTSTLPPSPTRGSRRILTPRSPHLHRAHSLHGLRVGAPPTGTIDAQQTPFLSPPTQRIHTAEPGVGGAPLLPTPPAGMRPAHGMGHTMPTPPITHARHSLSIPPSGSASPATSLSSYGQQTSPAPPYGHGPAHTAPPLFNGGPPSAATDTGSSYSGTPALPPERYSIPITSSSQSSYQLLTLETQQGPRQIPVDVQAASKVADEKRKRNAGASARFRARRKQKEAEANTTISKLQRQLRESNEDRDFYIRERDELATLLYQTPGGGRHFPRPRSPRLDRASAPSTSSGEPSVTGTSLPDHGEPSDSGRSIRPRTDSYQQLSPPTPVAQPAPPPGYPPASYAQSFLPPLVPAPAMSGQAHPGLSPLPPAHAPAGAGTGPRAQSSGSLAPRTPSGQRPPSQDQPYSPYGYQRSWPPTSQEHRPS